MVKQIKHPPDDDKSRAIERQLKATIQQLRASEQQLRAANQQLEASEQQLRAANQQLDASNQQLRTTQEELRKLNHDLVERVKELNCLYGLSHLAEKRDITLEGIFQGLVELIPQTWQYPEITAGRIIFEGRRYETANFRKTAWIQSADIEVHGRKAGAIEVCYLRKRPAIDGGAFLKQERELLNALAERLGRIIERMETEEALRETRSYLEKLINYANAPIVVWDPEFRITIFNRAFERLTGYMSDEVIGKKLHMLFPKASWEESRNKVELTLSGEYWESVEVPILCKNREIRLALWNSADIYAKDGTTLLAVIAQGQDITERKEAENKLQTANQQLRAIEQQLRAANQQLETNNQQLRANGQQLRAANQQLQASEQQLRATNEQLQAEVSERKKADETLRVHGEIMTNMSEGVYLIRASDGVIVYTNPKFDQMFGYRPGELIGKHVSIVNAPTEKTPEEMAEEIMKVLNEKGLWQGEICNIKKDGTRFWCHASVSIFDHPEHGKVWVSMHTDVTEHKQVERALRESEKLAAKGQLAAQIAHEINNPLAGIKNSFLLIKDAVPESHPYYRYVGLIEKEISRMSRVVHGMFELYRPDSEEPRQFSLDETVREVVELLGSSYRRRNVLIGIGGRSAVVTLPESSLRQVLYNIVKNAIEASPAGGEVEISTKVTDDALTISVRDQGEGISEQVRPHIFEPLFTTKRGVAGAGLGLGLSVSKNIVESMGGSVYFESKIGEGTVFSIIIPLGKG